MADEGKGEAERIPRASLSAACYDHDNRIYHEEVEGPLTLELLGDIAERKIYRKVGFTPLMVAAYAANATMVRELLARGADPEQTDRDGWTASDWVAHRRGYNAPGSETDNALSVVHALLQPALDPDAMPHQMADLRLSAIPNGPLRDGDGDASL